MDGMDRLSENNDEWSFRYIIGIDLGTTNSAVAYIDFGKESPDISIFRIPQLVAPGEVSARPLLPSFLYLPGGYELPLDNIRLPWNDSIDYVVGEFAREQGSLVPDRLVSSAKSWLCHAKVDRTAPILPWGTSDSDIKKVSPVEASARYLEHIRQAWNYYIAHGRDEHLFEEQLIVLTVPASFDEVARELTVDAAKKAGIPRLILLEEPLAAFYAWLYRNQDRWQERIQPGQIVLVCDVGGGTTDFTIVALNESEKGIKFDRLAVGDHLLLGGDNMDLALGRHIELSRFGKAGSLDTKRWYQLCHQCRKAKETILQSDDVESVKVTVVGRGTRLIGDTVSATVRRETVEQLILDGFFPEVDINEAPEKTARTGLTEWGLPYVQDPAITRHLAAFWKRFESLISGETGRRHPYPDFMLFNGGALVPAVIRERLLNVVGSWFREITSNTWIPEELHNPRPDLAVAYGAAYYGLVRLGKGIRVGAGTPRSYYVQVGTVEGERDKYKGLCIVPRGTEEGFQTELTEPSFQVITNRPVSFQLLSSITRLGDRLGDLVELEGDEVTLLPPIKTVLRFGKGGTVQKIPVNLVLKLTEVGTLDLWCKSLKTPHRWQLRFDVRQHVDTDKKDLPTGETLDEETIDKGLTIIRKTFTPGECQKNGVTPTELVKVLTRLFELPREKWSLQLIRRIADALIDVSEGRKLTFHHESRWLNLLGYCLRPGYGDPVDEWRIKQVWKIYHQGIVFPRQSQCRLEWWIFWRRVAGGLSPGQQQHVYQQVSGYFLGDTKKSKKLKKLSKQEMTELWMAIANFERLSADIKLSLGNVLLKQVMKSRKPRQQDLWSLSKFGARIPLYGPVDRVVAPDDVVPWVESLLSRLNVWADMLVDPLLSICRFTGDRARDLPDDLRTRVYKALRNYASEDKLKVLFEVSSDGLSAQEREWSFGESLPLGLILLQD